MNKKTPKKNTDDQPIKKQKDSAPKTDVESDTGKRPEKDTNPLPPNPNKVDNHQEEDS